MTHHSEALTRAYGDASIAEAVASGHLKSLDPRVRALCTYAVRLTGAPSTIRENDLGVLRAEGLDDRAIVDANQVVAYFNYVNRIALGLGVELEEAWTEVQRARRHYPLARGGSSFPTVEAGSLPWLSVKQMREVDRVMIEELGITLELMMENAGRSLARLAAHLLGGDLDGRHVRVLAGTGGNGGGGLVAARHLSVGGAKLDVWLGAPPDRLTPVSAAQCAILHWMNVPITFGARHATDPELVLDALLGYGQRGALRAETARLIAWAAGRRVLSLDVPSGLELATGRLLEPHVRAEATLTLALPKAVLKTGKEVVGDLFVADISVPPLVYEKLGIPYASPFGPGPIVQVAGAV